MVNAWILFKTVKQAQGLWNTAAERTHTLAWFKECVILSLCGNYTSRKITASIKLANPPVTNTILSQHSTISDRTDERYSRVWRKSSREVPHLQKITAYNLHPV